MVQTLTEKNYEFFLSTDVREFIGEWVIICEGKIVAHNKDVKQAVREAIAKYPNKKFMVARVPDKETMIF
ncbi:MAG: DUF5678 domain-containing protein [archaeon]|nr:DUF5678 domain-containing protein [archaeon]